MKAAVIYEHGGPGSIKIERAFPDPRPGPDDVILKVRATTLNYHDIFTRRGMTFPTLQASDRYIQANPQIVEKVVRAVAKTQKRLREDPEAGVKVAQKIFPALDVELIRNIIVLQRPSYIPTITEDAIRTANQFQKQAGVVKADFPYDKIVAVQFKAFWEQ